MSMKKSKIRELLAEFDRLELKVGEYAIFAGGVIAIRGIRETKDIDLLVIKPTWERLVKKYPSHVFKNPDAIRIGDIEIFHSLDSFDIQVKDLILSA